MPSLHTLTGAIYLLQIFGSAFLAILFLQSGIDKIIDHRGNLEWLKGHFAKSQLAGVVHVLLAAISILEVAAGVAERDWMHHPNRFARNDPGLLRRRYFSSCPHCTVLRTTHGEGLRRRGRACSLLPARASRNLSARALTH